MSDPQAVVDRLVKATNSKDLDAMVGCFRADYVNETPAHPARGFTGNEQVRTNWQQIFGFVPDIEVKTVATAVDGDTVWSEWSMYGARPDGKAHEMAGVIVFSVDGDVITRARFYLEPVERTTGDVNDAIRRAVVPESEQAGRPR